MIPNSVRNLISRMGLSHYIYTMVFRLLDMRLLVTSRKHLCKFVFLYCCILRSGLSCYYTGVACSKPAQQKVSLVTDVEAVHEVVYNFRLSYVSCTRGYVGTDL